MQVMEVGQKHISWLPRQFQAANPEQSMKIGIQRQFGMLNKVRRVSHSRNLWVAANCYKKEAILLQNAANPKILVQKRYNSHDITYTTYSFPP